MTHHLSNRLAEFESEVAALVEAARGALRDLERADMACQRLSKALAPFGNDPWQAIAEDEPTEHAWLNGDETHGSCTGIRFNVGDLVYYRETRDAAFSFTGRVALIDMGGTTITLRPLNDPETTINVPRSNVRR